MDVWALRCDARRWCAADGEDGPCGPCDSATVVHAHATTYAWAWTTDDSTDAFHVVNAIATTYAVDATSALEAKRAINDAKDAMGTRFTDAAHATHST